jgi:hypothetical protein
VVRLARIGDVINAHATADARVRAYAAREPFERGLVATVRASGHAAIGAAAFLARQTPQYPD